MGITNNEKNAITKDAPAAMKYEFDKYHAPFKKLLLDDAGRLFVQTFEKAINTTSYLYDVFDAEGRLTGRIPLMGTLFVMKKEKLYSLEEDEDGFQIVKRYTLKWLIK